MPTPVSLGWRERAEKAEAEVAGLKYDLLFAQRQITELKTKVAEINKTVEATLDTIRGITGEADGRG
jgi:hypothetical protein